MRGCRSGARRGARRRRHQDHANASERATCDYERLAREVLADADAIDAEEDERFGEAHGDELPPELATAQGRRGWLREAKRRLDERRAEEAKPIPRSRPERLKDAKRRLDEELWTERRANEAYEAYRARGVGRTGRRFSPAATPKPYTAPATPPGKVNITDLDSKLVKGMRGWVQGYNAQAVCNEQHLIIAAEVMTASPDFGHLGPMVTAARRELANAGVTKPPDVVVADAGYWHLEQMNEITGDGIPVLIPPDSSRRASKPKRPGWTGGAYDFMRSVLSTEVGSELYRQRAQLIEPIFGNTKHNRGFTRFHRRGRSAARTEWRLMATTHNLCKLHQHFTAEED